MRYLTLFLLTGCATAQFETFVFPQGETMECLQYEQSECGMALSQCGAEHTIEFDCMSDLRYVGPSAKVGDRCKEALEKKDAKLIQEHRCYPPDYHQDPRDEEVTK